MLNKTEISISSFYDGTCDHAYDLLGCHESPGGRVFRLWAPHAIGAFVVGDFNGWRETDPMLRTSDGLWEAVISQERMDAGKKYKFKIVSDQGAIYKSDPFGTSIEASASCASVAEEISGYTWRDDGWLTYRKRYTDRFPRCSLHVYRMDPTTWKKREDGRPYTYSELATELSTYVKQMGYTHIEWTWGGDGPFFAPSPQFGVPTDFMSFVDSMHEAGIGVFLRWNPMYISEDEHGLHLFDGTFLYEYEDGNRGIFEADGVRSLNLGKNEVVSFLISSAIRWLERYHIDGLSVCAASTAICSDSDKGKEKLTPEEYGDNRCLEAIRFFKRLNQVVKSLYPDVLMLAEETDVGQGVTDWSEYSRLGFDLKWNAGWTQNLLSYCGKDPIYRKYHHEQIIFPMTYAERLILPLSCFDCANTALGVHDLMFGDEWQRFAAHRALLGFMMTHPGKKLSFMGNEIGGAEKGNPDGQIAWNLLDDLAHAKFQHYVSELNHLYLQTAALWEQDDSADGFHWIEPNNRDESILSFYRTDQKGNCVIVVVNFTPVVRPGFVVGAPYGGVYEEILNSDESRFGGSGVINPAQIVATKGTQKDFPYELNLTLPPLGVTLLRCQGKGNRT